MASRLGRLWARYLLPRRPAGIVIHHSATAGRGDAHQIRANLERSHAERGWGEYFAGRVYHLGYHYLVMPDGTVIPGRPEWMPGAHTRGHNDMLGICLVGDFSRDARGRCGQPTQAQLRSAVRLVKRLLRAYRLKPAQVHLHCDLAPTRCPGEGFPRQRFYELLASGER
jgi:hypothetical protein